MTITVINTGSDSLATLSGEALVADSAETFSKLQDLARGAAKSVTLDLLEITQVDVTFFQSLCSLGNTFKKTKRNLTVFNLPDEHCVVRTGVLLGFKLEHYFALTARKP